jgi:hypothetical protein
MKTKFILYAVAFMMLSTATYAQYNNRYIDRDDDGTGSYLKIGTQIPLQHSIIYDHRVTPGFSINGGLGLITSPYTGMIFSGLENRGIITAKDEEILDRSFQFGISYQLGANFHFDKNYVRLAGQLTRINGDLAFTDLANLALNTNVPPFASFLNPIDIKSTIPMVGMLYGRRFTFPGSRSEIHAEVSVMKTLGHNTQYKTGLFIDNIQIVNDIVYNQIDNDLDRYFSKYGWLPSLNVYYVYKL